MTQASPRPLVVDVDGTLIKSDLLHESALQLAAHQPQCIPLLPVWLLKGKAHLKREIARRVDLDCDSLPLRDEVLALIREAQAQGRPVWIASASDTRYVEGLAARIGGIAGVLASDDAINLAGDAKADAIDAALGKGSYDYVGDRPVDLRLWDRGAGVYAVTHSAAFERTVQSRYPAATIVARPRVSALQMVRALRPHQWAKNLLVFVSMIVGHHLGAASFLASLLAFACFCMAASSAYLLNDLLDLPADRHHRTKRNRPFASGAVPVIAGVALSPLLLVGAFALAIALLPGDFVWLLALYYVLTITYSLSLKRIVLVDVITLAGLYTLRVLSGAVATQAENSPWLLTFSLFIFTCLALVKRCSELIDNEAQGKESIAGRAYGKDDLRMLLPMAAVAGYLSVLVIALYIESDAVQALYAHADRLWLLCPLALYWVSRMLVLCNRGEMHEDPVVFALSDRVGVFVGVAAVAIAGWATLA